VTSPTRKSSLATLEPELKLIDTVQSLWHRLIVWQRTGAIANTTPKLISIILYLAAGPICRTKFPPPRNASSSAACSALSRRRRPTVTQFPVTRCQICQRTVACRPGALSQTLTDDYRRVHPERWASPPSNTRITRPGEGRTRSCP
jgi:hypothetical protein